MKQKKIDEKKHKIRNSVSNISLSGGKLRCVKWRNSSDNNYYMQYSLIDDMSNVTGSGIYAYFSKTGISIEEHSSTGTIVWTKVIT